MVRSLPFYLICSLMLFAPLAYIGTSQELMSSGLAFIERGTYHPFWSLSLPRIILALLAGFMLAASGYLLQTTLKNPLADSGILGVNAGASLGAVCALLLPSWFGWSISAENALIAFSMAGGLLSSVPILIVSRLSSSSLTLLTGVAVTAILSACSSALIFTIGQGRTDLALQWMAGGLYGRGWEQVLYLLPWAIFALGFIALMFIPLKWVRYDDSTQRGGHQRASAQGYYFDRHGADHRPCSFRHRSNRLYWAGNSAYGKAHLQE